MNTNKEAKRILCYGDSNTWGWVPSSMGKQRYDLSLRWPGLLQEKLGTDYEVIEEGLGGRTTMFDDPRPEFPERNALKTLPIILESHLPLDYVIIMLGTTDTKQMMNIDPEQIEEGLRSLVKAIKAFKVLEGTATPKILIIVPPIVDETVEFASKLFKGRTEKARSLIERYRRVSEEEGVLYLNPNDEAKVVVEAEVGAEAAVVVVDKEEGVHMSAASHRRLSDMVCEVIKGC